MKNEKYEERHRNNSFGLEDKRKMKTFLNLAEKESFDFALSEAKKNPGEFNPLNFVIRMKNYFSKNYLSLVLDTKRRHVLDLGCGYGNLSLALSDIFKKVYSFDINDLCTKIVEIRAKEQSRKNITTISGNAFDLKIEKKLDAAFMVGVLEWVPLSHHKPPKESQKEILKKLYKKMDSGGKIVVGIENRFGAQYFLGRKDHGGLWGTNLVPRKIANLIYKLRRKGEYRTYTHTYWQYKKLFKDCGFSNVKIYLALTSYVYPKFIIPLEKDKFKYAIDNLFIPRSSLERILSKIAKIIPFSLVKIFSPHFIIVGEKGKINKVKKENKNFSKGIMRTGTANVSIHPLKQDILKMINQKKDTPCFERIKKINNQTGHRIMLPSLKDKIGNYNLYKEKFIPGKKIRPLPKDIKKISREIFEFVCQLKEKKIEAFFKNFNYGNIITTKNKKIKFIGLRNFKKEDPIMNLISFFESLYYYNEKFHKTKSKKEILKLFNNYINKYQKMYKTDASFLIKRYLEIYDAQLVLVKSKEFKRKIEKIYLKK